MDALPPHLRSGASRRGNAGGRSSHKWAGGLRSASACGGRREFNIRHGLLPAPAPPAAPAPPDSPPPECEDGSSSDTWTLSITASSPYTPASSRRRRGRDLIRPPKVGDRRT
ncbi:hypothetical protein ZWY2020_044152 [Hordeum vulgare]|nr:hypothetical protein ZWY2020_044152 [Hordeum vulgare]